MTHPGRSRVLVVDDSITVRARLVDAISADPSLTVAGEAADGRAGIELCFALRPDVITMDIAMPVMSGLRATEHIMAHCPTPILIVSAAESPAETAGSFAALAAGAVDVLDKPTGDEAPEAWAARLRASVRMAARIRVIRHVRPRLLRDPRVDEAPPGAPGTKLALDLGLGLDLGLDLAEPVALAAIGGSAGAPAAVARILHDLPPGFSIPILLVIHISPRFSSSLSLWLDSQSALPVRMAEDGAPLPERGVLTAPADRHILIERGRLRLSAGPERHSCRPSVDVLFDSVAREIGRGSLGCLLTGMGCDGAEGLLAIRGAGGVTIAQDEATSKIYGMPREAARCGAAAHVLPLDDITRALVEAAGAPRGSG